MKKQEVLFLAKLYSTKKGIKDKHPLFSFILLAVFMMLVSVNAYAAQLSINQFGNITLNGSIEHGDYFRLTDLVREHNLDQHVVIELNSSGGNLMESLRIGHYISLNNMSTLTFTKCESACVNILFSGKRYGASSNATISLHKPYIETNNVRIEDKIGSDTWWRIYGLLLSSLKDENLAKSIIGYMYSTEKYYNHKIESTQFELFGIISN